MLTAPMREEIRTLLGKKFNKDIISIRGIIKKIVFLKGTRTRGSEWKFFAQM